MIKLRPHHIMCFQGYEGKGYSQDFIDNMDNIYRDLKEKDNLKIKIVFSTDDVCGSCPNKISDNNCGCNEKVMAIDNKVIRVLKLKQKIYTYNELVNKLRLNINEGVMKDICGQCVWYENSKCKTSILSL
ncbi:hypothetical protein BJV85_000447 [Clostridium acetobutylicum]|uniref:Uncharacterized conserved predicted metal-binding protein n=1 Tax=Clostridium acetobutylicum (strain ATCC 824 / DSM 792 / JCM 1419 / IAM 19013 / LMG 5710 / NBRC 13948 / NRRL B-527 / VKM B-1787 / 2291 / W) TaxID=272562 RepID=Q97DL9_CLOAB|nr:MULTISPECIES: DUF1284 domain-containing protein [Clostridium]AAK81384.1 Uncharacterized conserved predicted metal-binding protein [Clostridium acetobutylicum ATCC 824]ADZ22496.1 Conserved hypothetical protein [Clostridium acetobutylicum EA 2018]AEI32858.1 hypothetical protein SMB_G3493 [Clostridium acetobutylicum DSM 1731]AWV80949.1 DUF1284 domain-containing protein [Clostridium acetobutylicum]MBC2393729.1 DUF1284 domain-containing protein [Clostridium acetobutylicum]